MARAALEAYGSEVVRGQVMGNHALISALADGSEIVLGLPIQDGGLGRNVRRVVLLAAAGATVTVCTFVHELLSGEYSERRSDPEGAVSLTTGISMLIIQLSIPACGYIGALYYNKQLTCCFCSCNLFIAIITIMSVIRLNVLIAEVQGQCGELQANAQARRSCERWTSAGSDKYLEILNAVLAIGLGSLAFWFGNSLYHRLTQDLSHFHNVTPLVGEAIQQPSHGEAGPAADAVASPSLWGRLRGSFARGPGAPAARPAQPAAQSPP